MGLIENILLSIVHLTLCFMDMLFIVILIKIVYDRWHIHWLEPIAKAVGPIINSILRWLRSLIFRIIGKSYQDNVLLIIVVLSLTVIRSLITNLFS